jgi:hypothetical protein
MPLTVIPHDSFIHDDLRFAKGHAVILDDHIALEFERRGLVRVLAAQGLSLPNVQDAGAAAPPSSSPADLPSPKRTVLKLKRPADETKHFE